MNDYVIGNWLNLWQECADWCMPTNDNINRVNIAGQEKPPQRLIDVCIEANFNFATGFFSHMFPPNMIWAKFRHPDPNIHNKKEVQDYFEKVSRVIHELILASNFSEEEFQSLLCMGCFGTNCISVEEDDQDLVRFKNFVVGKIRIQENYLGRVDVVGREFSLTARQAKQQFGEKALAAAGLDELLLVAAENDSKDGTENDALKFVHYVGPREDFDADKKNKENKPTKSVYVSRKNGNIVREDGFDLNPYKVARFSVGNDEVYGRGSMSMLLGTARGTNVMTRSYYLASELIGNPQWLVPDDDSVHGLSSRAGAKVRWRAQNPLGKPERLPSNGDPSWSEKAIEKNEARIFRMFFNHLFRPLEDLHNMTAFEVNERMTTDRMSLSAFTSRYLNEHVSPIMKHVYHLAAKTNRLPKPPPIMEDGRYEIDFLGPLAVSTRSFETMGALSTIRMIGEASQYSPRFEAFFDNIDPDKFGKDLWYSSSAGLGSLLDEKEVTRNRKRIADAAKQQQEIENAPALADAAQKTSGAVDPTSILAKSGG